MVMAARLSARLAMLDDADVARLRRLLERAALPVVAPSLGVERYLTLMRYDKKVESGHIRLVLLRALGQAIVTADFDRGALDAVLRG
jgi:3-dehydroquinate synthase